MLSFFFVPVEEGGDESLLVLVEPIRPFASTAILSTTRGEDIGGTTSGETCENRTSRRKDRRTIILDIMLAPK